jgi:hypothetical protein
MRSVATFYALAEIFVARFKLTLAAGIVNLLALVKFFVASCDATVVVWIRAG